MADRALHQRHARVGQRGGQRQAGPAGAGAEVGDPARVADGGQVERDERVGHVAVDRLGGVATPWSGRSGSSAWSARIAASASIPAGGMP